MKKQIIISSIIATTLLTTTTAVALSTNTNDKTSTTDSSLVATESSVLNPTAPAFTSKDETVFIIADSEGTEKSKYIGSTLYSGTEKLPFDFKVTYFLNGQEVSAADLAGKSGRVKITYKATPTVKYQNQYIPFITVTGVTLDRSTFSNIKIESGKIVSESTSNYIIAGYALTGLNENLGTDFLPDSFSIEADTTNFKISNTYTILLNEIIADLDTTKLNTVDSLISSVYQLSDGLNQIISGANTLSDGLSTALNGTKALYAGSIQLKDGAKQLSDGLNLIASNNDQIQYGANTIIETILGLANDALDTLHSLKIAEEYDEITIDNYQNFFNDLSAKITEYKSAVAQYIENLDIPEKQKTVIAETFDTAISALETANSSIENLIKLNAGIITYTDAVATAANGAKTLATGAATLSDGLGTLVNGENQLYNGSVLLKDGLTTFKTSGIDKLVNFAEKDLASFTRKARATITAAANYKNFGGVDSKSVKFIVKTASI